jgi:hypothetical protein
MKFFFPQEFVMAISNDRIIAIGDFIDSHSWLYYICCGITAFATHYLYCGACAERIVLRWRDVGIIVATIVVVRALSFVDNNLATAIDFAAFVFIPYLTGGKIKNAAVVYTTHCLAQNLSLSIRNLPQYMTNTSFAVFFFMTMECYLWLVLFFTLYNYKKEN